MDRLTPEELEILELYRSLSEEEKKAVLKKVAELTRSK